MNYFLDYFLVTQITRRTLPSHLRYHTCTSGHCREKLRPPLTSLSSSSQSSSSPSSCSPSASATTTTTAASTPTPPATTKSSSSRAHFTGWLLGTLIFMFIVTFAIAPTAINASPVTNEIQSTTTVTSSSSSSSSPLAPSLVSSSTPTRSVPSSAVTITSYSIVNVTIDVSPSPASQLQQLSLESSPSASNSNWLSPVLSSNFNGNLTMSLNGEAYCAQVCDKIACWPPTQVGLEAVITCFKFLGGVQYDDSQNATRLCLSNGSWAEKANYDNCRPVTSPLPETDLLQLHWHTRDALIIYYIGYALSLVALSIALWIFLYFKDLRCVRNTIHTNLMITYVLNDLTWIITATLQSNPSPGLNKASCYSFIVLTYFIGTNFFWMFVEGLYLYILVVKTFSIELINIQKYFFIGYGLPFILTIIWAPIKGYFGASGDGVDTPICTWQTRDFYDYIYVVPMLLVLLVNIFFLGKIMYVLITKLRVSTTAESQQYRKAAKALLVLIPLLGITYLLVIVPPQQQLAKAIVANYLQPILISIQGFLVAVLYCFLNAEVRHSVRHHFERWKTVRTLRGGDYPTAPRTFAFRSTRYGEDGNNKSHSNGNTNGTTGNGSNNGSSNSTTGNNNNNFRHHRGSSVSFTTSVTSAGTSFSSASGKNSRRESSSRCPVAATFGPSNNSSNSSNAGRNLGIYSAVRTSEDVIF